nr:hypothetical protein GCM10020092_052020 [Actinoplanes digitatis]
MPGPDSATARLRLVTRAPVPDTSRLTGWATAHGIVLSDFAVTPPALEDVYLALTEEHDDDR